MSKIKLNAYNAFVGYLNSVAEAAKSFSNSISCDDNPITSKEVVSLIEHVENIDTLRVMMTDRLSKLTVLDKNRKPLADDVTLRNPRSLTLDLKSIKEVYKCSSLETMGIFLNENNKFDLTKEVSTKLSEMLKVKQAPGVALYIGLDEKGVYFSNSRLVLLDCFSIENQNITQVSADGFEAIPFRTVRAADLIENRFKDTVKPSGTGKRAGLSFDRLSMVNYNRQHFNVAIFTLDIEKEKEEEQSTDMEAVLDHQTPFKIMLSTDGKFKVVLSPAFNMAVTQSLDIEDIYRISLFAAIHNGRLLFSKSSERLLEITGNPTRIFEVKKVRGTLTMNIDETYKPLVDEFSDFVRDYTTSYDVIEFEASKLILAYEEDSDAVLAATPVSES